jgi:antirestriction protein ArdC
MVGTIDTMSLRTHWTRNESGLERDFGREKFGDAGYAREELVAELGAAFLCVDLGITLEDREDHAAYIGSWPKVLRPKLRDLRRCRAHAPGRGFPKQPAAAD